MCNDYARMLQAFVPNFIRLFNVGCFQVFSCVFKCFQTYVAPVLAIFDPLAAVAKASSLTERRWFCIHVREKWKGKRSPHGCALQVWASIFGRHGSSNTILHPMKKHTCTIQKISKHMSLDSI
jgi:hypothetical protein